MDDRLVDLWIERKTAAQELRGLYEDRWIDLWMAYRNTKTTKQLSGQFWMQNKMLPDAFKVIETIIPQHVIGMYRDPRWYSVEAPSVAGQNYQHAVKSLLDRGWRHADMFANSVVALKYGAIMGHMIPKLWWNIETRSYEGEQVIAPGMSGPKFELPDLFSMWQDPSGKGRWWIEKIDGSMDELKARNKEFGGALYTNLGKVDASQAMDVNSQYVSTGTSTPSEVVEGISRTITEDPDHVEIWQCWGLVPESKKKYDDTQWRLQVIANGEVLIRDVPAPTPDNKPPYWNVQSVPLPHQIYGDSVLSWIQPLIERRSTIENYRMDEVLLNMFQQWLIDATTDYSPNHLLRQPGGAAFIDPGMKSLGDVMMPVPRTPVLPEAFNESMIKEDQINRTSGSTDHFQGQGLGSRASATEAGLVAQASGGRHQLQTLWLDEKFKREALERIFRMYQTRMQDPQSVEFGGKRDEITMADLQYDVDIFVDSGKFGAVDQQQVNGMLQLLGTFAGNPQTMDYLDYGRIAQDMAYRLGFTEAQHYVRSNEEVAQLAAARAQQELALAQAGGPSAQPGSGGQQAGASQ